jgi:hypothetical protein
MHSLKLKFRNNSDPHDHDFWMILAIVAMIIYGMMGCSSSYHLGRAQHHYEKAKDKDPSVSSIKTDSTARPIILPGAKVNFNFKLPPVGERLIHTEKDVKVITKRLPGDTVFLEVECPADTIIVYDRTTSEVATIPCTYKEFFKYTFGIGNALFYIIHLLIAIAIVGLIYVKLILPKFPTLFK